MVKLKMLSFHKIENVPDHILQEMEEFASKLLLIVGPEVEKVSPNIALAGLNWMLAAMLKHLITNNPEELRKAAFMSCKMLLKNMDILIDLENNKNKTL